MSEAQHSSDVQSKKEKAFDDLRKAIKVEHRTDLWNQYESIGGMVGFGATNWYTDQRQSIAREILVNEDGTYTVEVENRDLGEIVDVREFSSIENLMSWDVDTPWTDHIQPQTTEKIEEPDYERYETLDETTKRDLTRKATKVKGHKGDRLSAMVFYMTGRRAKTSNPYNPESEGVDNQEEVTFSFNKSRDAKHVAHVMLWITPYETATIEDWGDTVELTFELF